MPSGLHSFFLNSSPQIKALSNIVPLRYHISLSCHVSHVPPYTLFEQQRQDGNTTDERRLYRVRTPTVSIPPNRVYICKYSDPDQMTSAPNRKIFSACNPTFTIIPLPQRSVNTTPPVRKKMPALTTLVKYALSIPFFMLSSSAVGYTSPFPTLRFWSRAVTCYCSLLICTSYGVMASIFLRMVRRHTISQWAAGRAFANITSPLIGWDWEISGEENLSSVRPAVFISNHQRLS